MSNRKVLVITGPTATGKTALGVALAQRLNGEVISADSMQIYRGMDIGTAKVLPEETLGIKHHLIDVADPSESWSVARWVDAAVAISEDIFSRKKLPIIVGGTNLYIDSLLSGREFAENPVDGGVLRSELGAEYDRIGGTAFREKLREVDPERADKLHDADKKRLVRALEVFLLTGETITSHDERTRKLPQRWNSLRIGLSFANRDSLYSRIDQRVDKMIALGLYDEVRRLLSSGLSPTCNAMQAIGYKEIVEYLQGKCSADEASNLIKLNSRRYAKRQLTWLRRDSELHWILWKDEPDFIKATEEILLLWNNFLCDY